MIIKQVNGEYTAKHPRLRTYKDDAMDLLKTFAEFQLTFVSRNQNILSNGLAFAARTCLTPYEIKKCTTQVKYIPIVPDNERYWQVFDGDKQIEEFLQSKNELEIPNSDSDYEQDYPTEENPLFEEEKSPKIAKINLLTHEPKHKIENSTDVENEELEVPQSKDHNFPRGLVPLEEFFDLNDVAKNPKLEPIESDVEECNIGSEEKPKMIKLSMTLLAHIKLKYIELFK